MNPPFLTDASGFSGGAASAFLHNYTVEEVSFTENIVAYWTNFVKEDNPNGRGGQVPWNKFESSGNINNVSSDFDFFSQQANSNSRSIFNLNTTIENTNFIINTDRACSFWQYQSLKQQVSDDIVG